jgi:alpha,alpha-trehalose phosphorylase
MLDAARERAAELGHRGALFPWRTINGQEASPRYASGTAQYHINADVAYALRQHRNVSGDDEYTTVVNNNAYTNLMAKEHLEGAARMLDWLRRSHPAEHARLVGELGVTDVEVAAWRRAAARMYVPRHEELRIVLQDDDFLERKRWDFDGTPADRYPLLLHFHPLEIFRHQVIKQTDVVLATYLVGHRFSAAEKRRTFDYYDPLTTGDSTLSACIQSVVASEIGYPGAALDYFLEACAVDLLDVHGNTADGIHVASCGGTWLALVAGFAGLRDFDGVPRFAPQLPEGWERLRFRLQIRGRSLDVDITPGQTAYTLLAGDPLELWHRGEACVVRRGRPVRVHAEARAA